MTIIVFDVTLFRQQFPVFSNVSVFPDAMLDMYWDMATCYVEDEYSGCSYLAGDCRQLALNFMTAHLTALSVIIAGGEIPGLEQSATIDKVSVTMTPPPMKNQWQWWLNQTPYGQQLQALLQARSVGGFYIGGLPEGGAIRKVGGIY